MRRTLSAFVVCSVLLATLSLVAGTQDKSTTWTGWISDSSCGVKGTNATHRDCAQKCVKEKGAHWALYNTTDKSQFVLSGDDAMMLKMAAKEVTVKGTMDTEKKTITVTSMETMPAKKM